MELHLVLKIFVIFSIADHVECMEYLIIQHKFMFGILFILHWMLGQFFYIFYAWPKNMHIQRLLFIILWYRRYTELLFVHFHFEWVHTKVNSKRTLKFLIYFLISSTVVVVIVQTNSQHRRVVVYTQFNFCRSHSRLLCWKVENEKKIYNLVRFRREHTEQVQTSCFLFFIFFIGEPPTVYRIEQILICVRFVKPPYNMLSSY